MMRFTRDEVVAATHEYFDGDTIARDVFITKYALKDEEGNFVEKSPAQMHARIARELARIEQKYENPMSVQEIFCLLADVDIDLEDAIKMSLDELVEHDVGFGPVIPQGSPLSGIGNTFRVQSISNCFVIESPYDSYGGILKTDQEQAQIMKRRGGVGFDISSIRPRGLPTKNAAHTTDGIGVFMERYSNTCREVGQGGRRGALMISIDCFHPEVETFINIKRDKVKITGANVSVKIHDEFMQAVIDDSDIILRWPVDAPLEDATIRVTRRARDIWEQIVDAAWFSADPGVLFWDRVIQRSPSDLYASYGYKTTSTNPCGELPLNPGDSCRLLTLDVRRFVREPWTSNANFDYDMFVDVVVKAQRFMDDIIDLEIESVDKILEKIESDPEPQAVKAIEVDLWRKIRENAENGRRTGLGVTAVGDAIAMLGEKYGSDRSVDIIEEIYKHLAIGAYRSTVKMAEERGSFSVFSHELEEKSEFINQILDADPQLRGSYAKYGRRNIGLLTTAPVGSISIMLKSTSGIEPVISLDYKRRRKLTSADAEKKPDYIDDLGDKWEMYTVYHHGLKEWMTTTGNIDPKQSPYWNATAHDVDWEQGIKIQAAAQRWVCHSISRTANVPKNVTHDEIGKIYIEAWKQGCKGITVYRDQSKSGVLITSDDRQSWFDGILDSELEHAIKLHDKHSGVMPSSYSNTIRDMHEVISHRRDPGPNDDVSALMNGASIIPAPKRPKSLKCDIHRTKVTINGQSDTYLVLVGKDESNTPYEIFCGLSKHIDLPKKYAAGSIIKNGKKNGVTTYNLEIPLGNDEHIVLNNIVEQFDNPVFGAFTRTLSLTLRHKIPVNFIVEQLQKRDKHDDIMSFSKAIARVLKEYIPNGTRSHSDKNCPECGSTETVYIEGCVQCMSCGWGKC